MTMRNPKTQALGFWFLFLGILLWMTSCGAKKEITSSESTRDSVSVEQTITRRDTAIVVPAASVSVSADLHELSKAPVKRSSGNLKATLTRVGDQINCDCDQEKYELLISLQDKLIRIYEQKITERSKLEKIDDATPWYQKWLLCLGAAAAGFIIARLTRRR